MAPQPSSAADSTANRLRSRYLVALTLIATLTVFSQVVIQRAIAEEAHDSRIVNLAGRQRMLSQKIAKGCYALVSGSTEAARREVQAELEEALGLWQRSHAGLQRGDAELGLPGGNSPEVTALFHTVEPDFQAMVTSARAALLAAPGSTAQAEAVSRVGDHEPRFLRGMDAIVFRYDDEARQRVEHARKLELLLATFTLLVLLLEALFIFAPAVRRLRLEIRRQERSASTDELTGLANRRTGLAFLAAEMARAGRGGVPLAVCFVDLDRLKLVNDQHGHQAGDWMIKTLASVLADSIRAGDLAFRLGGDEFLLVLHACSEGDGRGLVARIVERLAAVSDAAQRPFRLSASFGVAAYQPTRHLTPDALIAEADRQMYRVKHTGDSSPALASVAPRVMGAPPER